jgi:predicted restriction endonuclease
MGNTKIVCYDVQSSREANHLSDYLKYKLSKDSIALGSATNGIELRDLLFNWADIIIVMDPQLLRTVAPNYQRKCMVCQLELCENEEELTDSIASWVKSFIGDQHIERV